MDFNSIFNRAPTGGLASSRLEENALSAWSDYVAEVAPEGRTVNAARIAKELRKKASDRLRYADSVIARADGIFKQSNKLDKYQTQELIQELDNFVTSRSVIPVPPTPEVTAELETFLDDNVRVTYDSILQFYQRIYDSGDLIYHKLQVERNVKNIGDLYIKQSAEWPGLQARYEALKADVKKRVPPHLHRLVDKVVELFIYDPYKLGLLYVRSNFPGAIGAFNGIE